MAKRGVAFEALDNGIPSCADPARMRDLADGLTAGRIDALVRKWPTRLPHPYTAADRRDGVRYDISMLQAEFALTQVFDRPVQGRVFFEEVMREILNLGRPDHVRLIFDPRVTKRTPSRYRTRVITDGVIPSLHVDYKHSRIKQYHNEGRAPRTETVVNDTYDFDVGRRLKTSMIFKGSASPPTDACCASNKSATTAPSAPERSTISIGRASSTASAPRHCASAIPASRPCSPRCSPSGLLPDGFRNRDLRGTVAPLIGLSVEEYGRARMTYDLRRLRLHGLIERIPFTRCYRVTDDGLRTALRYHRTYARVLRPTMSVVFDAPPRSASRLRRAVDSFDREVQRLWEGYDLAA